MAARQIGEDGAQLAPGLRLTEITNRLNSALKRARQGIRTPTACLEGTGAAITPASREWLKYSVLRQRRALA